MATISLRVTSWPRAAVIGLIRLYRLVASPLPSPCKFSPSCSTYALDAVTRHGALKGGWMAARRLIRCHPFTPGGYDPVP